MVDITDMAKKDQEGRTTPLALAGNQGNQLVCCLQAKGNAHIHHISSQTSRPNNPICSSHYDQVKQQGSKQEGDDDPSKAYTHILYLPKRTLPQAQTAMIHPNSTHPQSAPRLYYLPYLFIQTLFQMSSKPSDDQLRQAIDAIFQKYDTDKSGTLEGSDIFNLISDCFKSLGRNRQVKEEEVNQFVKAIDKNGDSKISKPELFEILKKLVNG